MILLGDSKDVWHYNTQQECVVCGTVYVTQTEKKAQGRDPLTFGTISGTSQEDIASSSIFVKGSTTFDPSTNILSAAAKGKEKTSEIPAVPAVRSINEQAINNNL